MATYLNVVEKSPFLPKEGHHVIVISRRCVPGDIVQSWSGQEGNFVEYKLIHCQNGITGSRCQLYVWEAKKCE